MESRWIAHTVPDAAALIYAAREEIAEESLLGLFELGDETLRRVDFLIRRIKDRGDLSLFIQRRNRDQEIFNLGQS